MCKHNNQVVLNIPKSVTLRYNAPGRKIKKNISIDPCLINEVKSLWSKGIRTTGCCCGHGKKHIGYIGVVEEDIPKMKKLGYEKRINELDLNREDSFIPKTKNDVKKDENDELVSDGWDITENDRKLIK